MTNILPHQPTNLKSLDNTSGLNSTANHSKGFCDVFLLTKMSHAGDEIWNLLDTYQHDILLSTTLTDL